MATSITEALAELQTLTVGQLRERYAQTCGEPALSSHRGWLIRRIAWRLQSLAEGGLSERARSRAAELANEADLHLRPRAQADEPRLGSSGTKRTRHVRTFRPGTILTRRYKGQTLQVRVLLKGFEFQGQVYPSLTAAARAATGSHWNGHHFFGLKEPR